MDKLNKYLHSVVKKHNGNIIYSQRSTYYHICGRIIRVSDHVGKNSDGSISIIYDAAMSDHYIIHAHVSGMVSIVNYENLKGIIKSFTIMPALIGITASSKSAIAHQVKEEKKTTEVNKNTIFGIDKSRFTHKQIKSLNKMTETFLKTNGNK